MDDLNARFRRGNNRDPQSLLDAGILVHQFDFMDDSNPDARPWLPGAGEWWVDGKMVPIWDRGDRISTTIINKAMTAEFGGNVPVFSLGLGGLILSPTSNRLLCSYAYDVDSLERTCQPRGISTSCIPGCTHPHHVGDDGQGNVKWCSHVDRDEWPCAWAPTPSGVGQMLQAREMIRHAGEKPEHKRFDDRKFYVEVIFDSQTFVNQLPRTIEAVFFMHVDRSKWECPFCMGNSWPDVEPDCVDATSGPKCKDYATRAHRAILRHFQLDQRQIPLLRLNPYDWDAPFKQVVM